MKRALGRCAVVLATLAFCGPAGMALAFVAVLSTTPHPCPPPCDFPAMAAGVACPEQPLHPSCGGDRRLNVREGMLRQPKSPFGAPTIPHYEHSGNAEAASPTGQMIIDRPRMHWPDYHTADCPSLASFYHGRLLSSPITADSASSHCLMCLTTLTIP